MSSRLDVWMEARSGRSFLVSINAAGNGVIGTAVQIAPYRADEWMSWMSFTQIGRDDRYPPGHPNHCHC
jgi:hypothetical protein